MFKDWANERCVLDAKVSGASRKMYIDFAVWQQNHNEELPNLIKWGKFMSKFFKRYRRDGRIRYRGIALREDIKPASEFDLL